MLTNEDVLKDRIATLEGELKYREDKAEKLRKALDENALLEKKIKVLKNQIKHLINELEEL
jgi:chaperonin cofactor prefoldin